MKKITVITINYNDAAGIAKTIKSVIAQTYPHIEYLVIDGGSTDGSMDVVAEYRQNITHAVSEPDKGIYDAMNKGINLSTGDYLIFLNSGDSFYKSNSLAKLMGDHDQAIIYGDVYSDFGNRLVYYPYPAELTIYQLAMLSLPHQATLIRKDVFEKLGLYNTSVKITADWQHFMRAVFIEGFDYKHVHFPVAIFDSGGVSSNLQAVTGEKSAFMREHDLFTAFLEESHLAYSFNSQARNTILYRTLNRLWLTRYCLPHRYIIPVKKNKRGA